MNLFPELISKLYSSVTKEEKNYNTLIGKRFHSISEKIKRKSENPENISLNFKNQIKAWLKTLSIEERLLVLSIENDWYASIICLMYQRSKIEAENVTLFHIDYSYPNFNQRDKLIKKKLTYRNRFYLGIENCHIHTLSQKLIYYVLTEQGSQEDSKSNYVDTEDFTMYSQGKKGIPFNQGLAKKNYNPSTNIFSKSMKGFMSFGKSYLEDIDEVLKLFDIMSDGQFLTKEISVTYDNASKIYHFDFPPWFKKDEYNSIGKWITALVEQAIYVKYFIINFNDDLKQIPKFPSTATSTSITKTSTIPIITTKQNLLTTNLQYLHSCAELAIDTWKLEENLKVFLESYDMDQIDIKEIKQEVAKKKEYQDLMNAQRQRFYECPTNTLYISNCYDTLDMYPQEIRKIYMSYNKKHFLEYLFELDLDHFQTQTELINREIISKLQNDYKTKISNEILIEEEAKEKTKTKKKKKAGKSDKKQANSGKPSPITKLINSQAVPTDNMPFELNNSRSGSINEVGPILNINKQEVTEVHVQSPSINTEANHDIKEFISEIVTIIISNSLPTKQSKKKKKENNFFLFNTVNNKKAPKSKSNSIKNNEHTQLTSSTSDSINPTNQQSEEVVEENSNSVCINEKTEAISSDTNRIEPKLKQTLVEVNVQAIENKETENCQGAEILNINRASVTLSTDSVPFIKTVNANNNINLGKIKYFSFSSASVQKPIMINSNEMLPSEDPRKTSFENSDQASLNINQENLQANKPSVNSFVYNKPLYRLSVPINMSQHAAYFNNKQVRQGVPLTGTNRALSNPSTNQILKSNSTVYGGSTTSKIDGISVEDTKSSYLQNNSNSFQLSSNNSEKHQMSIINNSQPANPHIFNNTLYPYSHLAMPICNNYYIINSNVSNYLDSVYYMKLQSDINEYKTRVSHNVKLLNILKARVVKELHKLIKSSTNHFLKKLPESSVLTSTKESNPIEITTFGSFNTELSIESSDVDLLVTYSGAQQKLDHSNMNMDKLIKMIIQILNESKLFSTINPILTASVPIIKLKCKASLISNLIMESDNEGKEYFEMETKQHDILEQLNSSISYIDFPFSKEEFNELKFDLTFINHDFKVESQQTNESDLYTQKSIIFINSTCEIHPEIRPIILVLKRLLTETNLNSYYNGGISSYSLFHLVFSFVKLYKTKSCCNNPGAILLELLDFYTKSFDFYHHAVDSSLNK